MTCLDKLVILRRLSEEREEGLGARDKWEEGGRETFLRKG